MLKLTVEPHRLRYDNGFNAEPPKVTRFGGEQWERVGSDLVCGIADVFQDVGIIATGRSKSISLEALSRVSINGNGQLVDPATNWAALGSGTKGASVYAFSEDLGWLFVPDCREAVEDMISWIMWTGSGEPGFYISTFSGCSAFREQLESTEWSGEYADLEVFLKEYCIEKALFRMRASPGSWSLFPGSVDLGDLIRLAEPVVAKINTQLTD